MLWSLYVSVLRNDDGNETKEIVEDLHDDVGTACYRMDDNLSMPEESFPLQSSGSIDR